MANEISWKFQRQIEKKPEIQKKKRNEFFESGAWDKIFSNIAGVTYSYCLQLLYHLDSQNMVVNVLKSKSAQKIISLEI